MLAILTAPRLEQARAATCSPSAARVTERREEVTRLPQPTRRECADCCTSSSAGPDDGRIYCGGHHGLTGALNAVLEVCSLSPRGRARASVDYFPIERGDVPLSFGVRTARSPVSPRTPCHPGVVALGGARSELAGSG